MNANRRLPNAIYLLCCCLLFAAAAHAQPGRWQCGIGTSVHLSNPELAVEPAATSELALRSGLAALARYRLNRKANWQWGPFRNRLNLFWETGLRADGLAYAYVAGGETISRDYLSLEVPLKLAVVSEARGFPGWRKRGMNGYGRLGGSVGVVLPKKVDKAAGGLRETAEIGGIRAALHLSSGLLRKMKNGSHASVGIFARIGLTPVVRGQLASAQIDPPLPFRSAGSLFGLEWSCFFGKAARPRLPEEPVDMILCPRL